MSKDAPRRRSAASRKRTPAHKPKAMVAFVKLAMTLARQRLSPYGRYKSRHDFTQPQLMTILVLRAMGLRTLPNYSTLNKFAHRVGVLEVLDAILGMLAEAYESSDDSACTEGAMDATGLETSSASVHYVSRKVAGSARGL